LDKFKYIYIVDFLTILTSIGSLIVACIEYSDYPSDSHEGCASNDVQNLYIAFTMFVYVLPILIVFSILSLINNVFCKNVKMTWLPDNCGRMSRNYLPCIYSVIVKSMQITILYYLCTFNPNSMTPAGDDSPDKCVDERISNSKIAGDKIIVSLIIISIDSVASFDDILWLVVFITSIIDFLTCNMIFSKLKSYTWIREAVVKYEEENNTKIEEWSN